MRRCCVILSNVDREHAALGFGLDLKRTLSGSYTHDSGPVVAQAGLITCIHLP